MHRMYPKWKSGSQQRSNRSRQTPIYNHELQQEQLFPQSQYDMSRSAPTSPNPPEFNLSALVKIFAMHYTQVERTFRAIEVRLTQLETKMATLFGHFNRIEWSLAKKVHELAESSVLNSQLFSINAQIEHKMASLKADYDSLKKNKYISNLEVKLDELKECVHKFEVETYRNKFNRHQEVIFEDIVDKLDDVLRRNSKGEFQVQRKLYQEIIGQLVAVLKGEGQLGQLLQEKIQENIKLKFKLIKNGGSSCVSSSIDPILGSDEYDQLDPQ